MKNYILVINPGSTSTKIGLFNGNTPVFEENFHHNPEDLQEFSSILEQAPYRKTLILNFLKKQNIAPSSLKLVMARGGLLKPVVSGVYQVNKAMLNDLVNAPKQHASNLAAIIANDIATENSIKAYIADPVVVDELCKLARFTGHPELKRISIFHALNQKAVARKFAQENDKKYENLNLIVVHMGGGITVGAHQKGKVIDVNQGFDGEGPFSPERTGTLPTGDLIKLAMSGKYTLEQMQELIVGKGGVNAYLGTNDMRIVEDKALIDDNYKIILDAMCFQIAKFIGAMATVLKGDVDAILLTGGIAYSKYVTAQLKDYTNYIATTQIYPGEDELEALAFNGNLVLENAINLQVYK
ncbi:butyrate kinase [Tenacibaculum finnmarkense genomovar ulcerans]|uniref:butyrate kinase n=1 Tax=Tenacibaculum finnmarkense TaxID=2781243 RepID=UPI001E470132|nr:butyrate kinase [Tenacibaculum finnmarkense]MCD8433242.1 butyrate kinase [Tenacibaculum finnmarkense genomovar ulcerans]